MTKKYLVNAVTMHDGEVNELKALGVDITVTNGSQDQTEFEVELSDEQAAAVRAHGAVFYMTEMP